MTRQTVTEGIQRTGSGGSVGRYTVDPAGVAGGAADCHAVAATMASAWDRIGAVAGAAPGWAVDGGLPELSSRLLAALGWAAGTCARDAEDLAARLAAAASGYAAADGQRPPRA